MNKVALTAIGLTLAGYTFAGTTINYTDDYPSTAAKGAYDNGGQTLLPGHRTDQTVGVFIQFVADKNKNGIGAAAGGAATKGLSDAGDEVIDTFWMGKGAPAGYPSVNGVFSRTGFTYSFNAGDVFYVRIWNKPATDYAAGFIPLADAVTPTFYKDVMFTASTAAINTFNVNTASGGKVITDTLLPVPEPTTMALFGLGMVALAVRRIRK